MDINRCDRHRQLCSEELLALITGQEIDTHENTRGITALHETVMNDPPFETVILPAGDGVAVSHKQETVRQEDKR